MSETVSDLACSRCGASLQPDDLACPNCGLFVHIDRLRELSEQAQIAEKENPAAAALLWGQCLELLPQESSQWKMVRQRQAALISAVSQQEPQWNWRKAIQRTGGSMVLSIAVYSLFLGWAFAAGFVLLILVHEMGHVLALRKYGIKGSPPFFVPFVGAIITVPRMPDALQEAIVGIAGPIFGTIGAITCLAIYFAHPTDLLLSLAFYGVFLNLFNLIPVPPLDGGRVMAAVSPWVWPLGLIALLAMIYGQFVEAGHSVSGISPILVLVLVFAMPRLWRTFRYRERTAKYYQIPRSASWAVGAAYVLLAGLLVALYFYTGVHLGAAQSL